MREGNSDTDHPIQRAVPASEDSTGESALSCNNCRKRKLRCSREIPTCQQCRKSGNQCAYESKREKPGMKTGAIDNLHRRLDALERQVNQQSCDRGGPSEGSSRDEEPTNPYSILASFAREFQRFNDAQIPPAGLNGTVAWGPTFDSQTQYQAQSPAVTSHLPKRRRLEHSFPSQDIGDASQDTELGYDELELVLEAYFSHIHPWIPMVHEGRLRRRLADTNERGKVAIVVRSMTLVAAKYIGDEEVSRPLTQHGAQAQLTRDSIVAAALRELSVENMQALIMIAFHDIGSGQASTSWSIVGALSRNVEYLQLAVENDESGNMTVSQPFISLEPPKDWAEAEERRRVFWTSFNLDRLCSITMGWNTSLTSDDVNRRLPCDGIKWRKEDAVSTPYFGIWDKAAGRIGNPIAFLPSYYAQAPQSHEEEAQTPSETGTSPGNLSYQVDMSTVGAFAYCIEATESLSRVTSYFLQQKVNMRDQKDLSRWLTRFKELDLRLVHWKMLLPQKWKVDVSQRSSRMDPNLTLAHVTHNASMILLHQPIAYPLPEWPFKSRLPSSCSAQTCRAAAEEIATITDNYLKNALPTVPITSQFAFCLYVAARTLLLQWRSDRADGLATSFWSLIESLEIMARRWEGNQNTLSLQPTNLAAKYSQKLTQLYKAMSRNATFPISVFGYTREIDHSYSTGVLTGDQQAHLETCEVDKSSNSQLGLRRPRFPPSTEDPNEAQRRQSTTAGIDTIVVQSPSLTTLNMVSQAGGMPMTPGFEAFPNSAIQQAQTNHPYGQIITNEDDLGAISQMFLNPEFMDKDRIISYNDNVFRASYEGML